MFPLFTECIWRGLALSQNNVRRSFDRPQKMYKLHSFALSSFGFLVNHQPFKFFYSVLHSGGEFMQSGSIFNEARKKSILD